ncbi:MAG: hypothetical protein U0694_12005 [Anaerolineae bacterium]
MIVPRRDDGQRFVPRLRGRCQQRTRFATRLHRPMPEQCQRRTRSERVERNRRTILEMLNSTVDLAQAPDIQHLMDDYGADRERFPDAERREHPLHDDNPFYVRDYSQCVLCWRCVQVCAEDAQYTFALTLGERGFHTHVTTLFDIPMTESPLCVLWAVYRRLSNRCAQAQD